MKAEIMSQKIHYQDDLFLLSVLAKSLDSGLSVEADPEFYLERLAEDVFFIDSSIRKFKDLLSANSHLMDRSEYLKLLERTARTFAGSLERLASGASPMSSAWERYLSRLEEIARDQKAMLAELVDLLKNAGEGANETELVSSDELSELLRE